MNRQSKNETSIFECHYRLIELNLVINTPELNGYYLLTLGLSYSCYASPVACDPVILLFVEFSLYDKPVIG